MRQDSSAASRRGLVVTALAVCALLALSGCANKSVGDRVDDGWITSKVKAKLAADPDVSAFEIDVDTTEGVVRLSGTVEDEKARSEAVKLAENTDGVVGVINEIALGDPTLAQHVDDKWIESKIKAKFTGDPDINPFNIDVDSVRGGEVTLSGTVDDDRTRDEAERLARSTDGVKHVSNRIEIKGEDTAAMMDEDIDRDYDVDEDRVAAMERDDDLVDDRQMADRYGEPREGVTGLDRTADTTTGVTGDYTARKPTYGQDDETVVATVVSVDGDTLVVDTDSGRRVILIDEVDDRPANLTPGMRIGVMFHDEDGELVATRLSDNPDDAEWMTFASPDRADSLPATASPLALFALAGLILLSGGALMRARRTRE
jgi:hyperosmotically inducible protein